MGVKVSNNAFGTISAGINSSATTVTLDSGQGARFPTLGGSDHFYGTLIDTSNNVEIIKVTARSTDSMTVVRAQDNTTARAFAIGDRFELRPTAALFEDILTEAVPAADTIVNSMIATDAVNADSIAANAVGASELNVSGNGSSGQVLSSDADGTFSWATPSSGKVLQVVSVTKTDTFTTSSSSFTDITGLTANITPASTSNKVYINLSVQGSQDVNANRTSYQLIRDNTAISIGDQAGSRSRASSGLSSQHPDIIASSSVNFLDSPSTTSQITYKVRVAATAGSGNAFVNRTENDGNESGMPRYASTITLMEIAG